MNDLANGLLEQLVAQNVTNAQTLGEIKQAVESLAGPEGRVTRIERDLAWQNRKQWIHSVIIVPLFAGIMHVSKYIFPQ